MKKIFSVLLAVALVFTLVPFGNLAVKSKAADEIEFTFTALKVKDGEDGVVIDVENNLVYGVPHLTSDLGSILENGEGYSVEFVNKEVYAGTGSSVVISKNETELATFKTVTYGDTNGDGVTDVLDIVFAERLISGKTDVLSVDKECLEAVKLTADGESVNNYDYSSLVNGILSGEEVVADRTFSEIDNIAHASFDEYIYTGTPLTPDFELTLNGKTLVEGVDYTVTYEKNEELGEALVTVSAPENSLFAGSKVFKFTIPGTVSVKLPKVNQFLYRVGNANNVALSSLFATEGNIGVSTGVTVKNVAGNASGVYTASSTQWDAGALKFSGTGVVEVVVNNSLKLNLEVVNGKNATTAQSATSNDVILLNDVSSSGKLYVTGNHILYGNGFKITDTRKDTSNAPGFLTLENARLDNVEIVGLEYPELVTSGPENQYYSPCVDIGDDTEIYNSHISGCRFAVQIGRGNVLIENSLIEGGTNENIALNGGTLTLKNCITSKSLKNTLQGLGVVVGNKSAKLNLEGTFKQYNWLTSSQIPSDYASIMKSMYDSSTYAYSSGGQKYVNVGILFYNTSDGISEAEARAILSGSPSNAYGYTEKTVWNITGTSYTQTAATATASDLNGYVYETVGQYYTDPVTSFDFTNKNYIEKTADSNKYCYYDSSLKKVNISYDSEDGGFSWNPMILSVGKYGSSLDYTVSMNGVDYTNKNIVFTASGDYEVVYRYSDENGYSVNDGVLNKNTKVYEKTVKITVTAVDPEDVAYHPTFTYTGGYNAKKVVAGNNTYIMPDVTATSDKIGSTTVGGQTIYYPIVTVGPTSKNGNTAYSSGMGYYFAPVFSELNIVDCNQSTGAQQYSYNKSSTKWPHGKSVSNGPDSAIFGFDSGEPYARSTNAQYYRYKSNNNGLCYTTEEIEKDNAASTHLVRYYYVANDGVTYYYYIKYSFEAMAYGGGCFATGTLITLADGTQKPVEQITFGDKILAWDFYTGTYVEQDVALLVYHGENECDVLNTVYSDGTVLRTIGKHGLFDYDLNKFVYITPEDGKDYVGHTFVKYNPDGSYDLIKMTDAYVTSENTGAYSITSAGTANAFAQGILTLCPPEEFYNWMEMGDKLRYDLEGFNADVEKYGLYDYEVFKDYATYEQFVAFNGAYLKIPVEKGIMTFEHIIELIEECQMWISYK